MDSLRLILSNAKYFAPAWVFASLNILTGTWVLYLPHVKEKFSLNDGQIGIALFCLALGLLISIPFVPYATRRLGVGRATIVGIILFATLFNLPLISPSYILLCISLLVIGVFSGFTDIAMNALVSTIEEKTGQSFMSSAHGFFSMGGFIGAGVGSFLISIISVPAWHMFVMSIIILVSNIVLAKHYIQEVEEKRSTESNTKETFQNLRPLLGLAIVAFIIMFNEGAVEHWSNIFLNEVVGVIEKKAGLGFIAFSLCMTLGRFLGDGLSDKFGTINIISYGCLIGLTSYFFVLSTHLTLTVVGFGLLGLGLSVIVPELFRLAGQTRGVQASVGISVVSGVGFAGFLIGPLLLGLISNITNLKVSYIFLASLVFLAFLITLIHLRRVYMRRSP